MTNSASIIAQIRKNRQVEIDLSSKGFEGKKIIITRPTELDRYELLVKANRGHKNTLKEQVLAYSVNWKGFVESDFIPGDDSVVEFDKELLTEWLEDKFDIADFILDEIITSIKKYEDEKAEREKNV